MRSLLPGMHAQSATIREQLIKATQRVPFVPHPALRSSHAQTIVASMARRRIRLLQANTESRYFDVENGVRVLAHCSWQPEKQSTPTLLMLHGLEGSTQSQYMLGTAEKALKAGFNAIRLNMRNCGGTEHLSSTLYHAGLTDDLRFIIRELAEQDRLSRIYLAGYSLGGNVVLKLAGEYGSNIPAEIEGIAAVSPTIHLASCVDAVEMRSNLAYHWRFVASLRGRLRRKARFFPGRYDMSKMRGVWTIRKFDDTFTAPLAGFRDVDDYYERASSLPLIARIQAPTMIIHSKDDPIIPVEPFNRKEIIDNPNVTVIAPDHGGHVGFISAHSEGADRFWSELRVIDFVRLLSNSEKRIALSTDLLTVR